MRYGDMALEELLAKKKIRKAIKGGRICPRALFTNFLHQSFLYLDTTEKVARILWEVIPVTLMSIFLSCITNWSILLILIVSVGFVHFLNWVFNNNFWNCMNCVFPWLTNRGTVSTISYLNQVHNRLQKYPSITGIMFLGSLSRFQWHDRSDIDMRILRKPGIVNGIVAALLTSRERFIAFIKMQPLDLYLADSPEFLKHHRKDEQPIFTLWRDVRLNKNDFPGEVVPLLKAETFNIKI